MKRIFPFFMGMAFVFAFGLANAENTLSGTGGGNNRMITSDDLMQIHLDPNKATLNQMPAGSEAEGSGAGGIISGTESPGTEYYNQGTTPVGNGLSTPGAEGSDAGSPATDSDTWQGGRNQGQTPGNNGTEGSGAGSSAEGGATDSGTYRY